jgi:hypothetical protein
MGELLLDHTYLDVIDCNFINIIQNTEETRHINYSTLRPVVKMGHFVLHTPVHRLKQNNKNKHGKIVKYKIDQQYEHSYESAIPEPRSFDFAIL